MRSRKRQHTAGSCSAGSIEKREKKKNQEAVETAEGRRQQCDAVHTEFNGVKIWPNRLHRVLSTHPSTPAKLHRQHYAVRLAAHAQNHEQDVSCHQLVTFSNIYIMHLSHTSDAHVDERGAALKQANLRSQGGEVAPAAPWGVDAPG